jgi:hypothetical protein
MTRQNTPKQTMVVNSAVSWNRHRLVTMAPSFRAGVNPAAFASFACLAGTSIAWIRLSLAGNFENEDEDAARTEFSDTF